MNVQVVLVNIMEPVLTRSMVIDVSVRMILLEITVKYVRI